jgi:hypothetical protein
MFNRYKKEIVLVLITVLFTLTTVGAVSNIQKVTAYINGDLKITYNGDQFQPREEDGTLITPIVYNNRTYLPVRAIAELTEMYVDYDDNTKTVILEKDIEDETDAIPYKDAQDQSEYTDSKDSNENSDIEYEAPKVYAVSKEGKIIMEWSKAQAHNFKYYKIVASKYDETPSYPDNGYLYCITDINTLRTEINNSSAYQGGDFGEYFVSGHKYYVTVTAVYEDRKVTGNAVKVEFK